MLKSRSYSYLIILMIIMGWMLLTVPLPGPARAQRSLFQDSKGTIAIDPGHGGSDAGAQGAEGSTEKEICLAIVRRMIDLMEPAYRIALTRSSDYNVKVQERSAVANNQKADLLISLHAGAGFLHSASGTTIYYYQPPAKTPDAPAASKSGTDQPIAWYDQQLRHIPASRQLAERLQQTLETAAGIPKVQIVQAPLAVLQGADMPAVVIEVGYLTNPAEEKRLLNPEWQEVLAQAIVKGIESFLTPMSQKP